ncbi:MAG: glutathione S-transferase C-terminal domain-containing protein, partial [Sneathiella sp.]|nr:glutathione S-transferase C-terminal domain-containing protein [Sneathiella sp.]
RLLLTEADELKALPKPKVGLLPTFFFSTAEGADEAVVDSTPIIRRLEENKPGRSVLPKNPVLAFLDFLLEDFADEWLTKAMFHYRWYYPADSKKSATILPHWRSVKPASDDALAKLSKEFGDRQISRLYVVGSNDTTAPVIEQSYQRYICALNTHLEQNMFLFGMRPSAADFAAYGQLTQLAEFDPTPAMVTEKMAPRVFAWVDLMDDLSGLDDREADWISADAIPASLIAILKEVGRVYTPVMLANAKALMSGADTVETVVDGKPWVQQPFPYQGKCLQWLREQYQQLNEAHRQQVDSILDGTGCEPLLR